jgi:hypothetical protein
MATCECGCGRDAGVYRKEGVRGQPRRFIHGHNGRRPILSRIFEKVDVHPSGCWDWQGSLNPRGYGKVGTGGRHGTGLVHRVVYELFVGSIPDGLTIDHLCANKRCVNPMHLEPVTAEENHRRGQHGDAG